MYYLFSFLIIHFFNMKYSKRTDLVGGNPARGKGVGTRWSLRSIPPKPLYDSMNWFHYHNRLFSVSLLEAAYFLEILNICLLGAFKWNRNA